MLPARPSVSILLAGFLILAPSATPVLAQGGDSGEDSSDAAVLLVPYAGAHLPGVDGIGDVTAGVDSLLGGRESTLVAGGSLQFASPDGPVNLRVSALRTTSALVSAGDAGGGSTVTDDFTAVTGDLVLRPLPRFLLQPYVLGGAGTHRRTLASESGSAAEDSTGWSFVGRVGAGLDVRLGTRGVVISAEVVDYLSDIGTEDGASHDAFALVGLGIPLF